MIAAAQSASISLVLPRVRVQIAIRRAHVVPSSIYVVPPTPCKRRTASMDGVSVGLPHVVGVVVQPERDVLCIATTNAWRQGLTERRRFSDRQQYRYQQGYQHRLLYTSSSPHFVGRQTIAKG